MSKSYFVGCSLVLLFGGAPFAWAQATVPDVRKELADAAEKLTFYGRGSGDANPAPSVREHEERHFSLFEKLENQKYDRKDLITLLKDDNPRVRTLAAHLLARRVDVKALPLLVAMVKDDAATFPKSAPPTVPDTPFKNLLAPPRRAEPQTVGQVVRKLVDEFLNVAGYTYGIDGHPTGHPGFDDYWAKRKDRDHCASWFYLEMHNAMRRTQVKRSDRVQAVQEVRKRIDKLPEPDRTFTLLFVHRTPQDDILVTNQELIAACKQVGPEKLLKLLQGEIPSDDPDLQMRRQHNYFYHTMMGFVLRNATALLRPDDAPALIEAARGPRNAKPGDDRLNTPVWYLAALELQPGKRTELMDQAWKQIQKAKSGPWSDTNIKLAQALRTRYGDESQEIVVNLFYHETPHQGKSPHQRGQFLHSLSREKKPAEQRLIGAIVHDKRFDSLDWESLYQLGLCVNAWESTPVVNTNELNTTGHPLGKDFQWELERARKEFPRETEQIENTLARWRQALRKAVAVPQAPR